MVEAARVVGALTEVRLATVRDLPALDLLIERAYGEIRTQFGMAPTVESGKYAAEHGILNDQGVVVAVDGEKLVGFTLWVWWGPPMQREGEAMSLGVWTDPAYRRCGLSTLMGEVAAEKCREQGVQYVMREAAASNAAGLAVIRKSGSRPVGCTFRMEL